MSAAAPPVHPAPAPTPPGPPHASGSNAPGHAPAGDAPAPSEPAAPTGRSPFGSSEGRMSLFGEILDWMLAPLLLLLPISVTITYLAAQSLANKPFDQALDDNLRALAAQVRLTPQGRVQFNLPLPARDLLRSDETDQKYIQVLGVRGEFLSGDRDLPVPPEDQMATPKVEETQFRDDAVAGTPVRVAYTWVQPDEAQIGPPVLVQVAETLAKRDLLARDIITGVIFPQFLILPLSVVLVYLGLTRGLRPLSRLQERIRERRPDDMSPIDERVAPDEVKPLVVSINGLLAKLASTLHTQKRFIADAAHQMKTPLAGLRTQAELAMRQTDPDELRASLRQLSLSTQRATHVINQLLALARTEHSGVAANRDVQTVDLAALARDALRDMVPLAMERRIDLGLETPEGASRVPGQPLLLKELLKNLVDNALRYTPCGGSVTVRVEADLSGRNVVLAVEDTGPGIAPAERERVFDAFYRGTDSAGVDGSGLGLAIVKEIALQHNAEIRLGYNPRQIGRDSPGTLLQLSFPNGTPPAA